MLRGSRFVWCARELASFVGELVVAPSPAALRRSGLGAPDLHVRFIWFEFSNLKPDRTDFDRATLDGRSFSRAILNRCRPAGNANITRGLFQL